MAGGERGVERAGELLRTELVRTLKLIGVNRVRDLTPDHVSLRDC
jgi:L-lactate dehydrogenase (cytochrome)